ncbi:unnamed protein product [Staurois parvus]|uniref:Uncharacterized protein n=1 Tax=Staurois parvus TaxID=386267 RepID=A0ABN9ENY2_9NEOB|nr:unnamed protein product [Staurois parvus]
MYTDDQGTDDQCSPSSATCQCPSMPPISAHQCHLPVPISASYQCPSELPFSVTYQLLPISATYQCCLSVPYMSAAFQCPSVMPVNAHQCLLLVPPHQCPSVPPISAHQCSLSVPISAASLSHISEGEKSLIYKIL